MTEAANANSGVGEFAYSSTRAGKISVFHGIALAKIKVADNSPIALAQVREKPAKRSLVERGISIHRSKCLVLLPKLLAIMSSPVLFISLKRLSVKLIAKGADM